MIGCEIRPEFYTHSEPVARKEHQCCECHAPIPRGEKYFRGVGKWDGDISVHCQHILCMEACMLIRDTIEGECISFGGLMDYYGEYRRDFADTEAGRKLMRMVAKVRVRERRSKSEKAK